MARLEARIPVLEDAVAFRDARLEAQEKRLRPPWLVECYGIPKRRVT